MSQTTSTETTLEAFEDEARQFLDTNATRKEAERKFVWGEGSDRVVVFEEKDREAEVADVRKACEWRGKKFDAGFGWIGGPAQYGGRGLASAYDRTCWIPRTSTSSASIPRPGPSLSRRAPKYGSLNPTRPAPRPLPPPDAARSATCGG